MKTGPGSVYDLRRNRPGAVLCAGMGKKMLVSLALEGKFASHGLSSMDQDDDVLTSLARELVTEKGIGERAAAVWRSLQKERQDPPADPPGDLVSNAPPLEAETFAVPPSMSNVIELPNDSYPVCRPGRRGAGNDQQLTFGLTGSPRPPSWCALF